MKVVIADWKKIMRIPLHRYPAIACAMPGTIVLIVCLGLSACSAENMFGRIEAQVGGHQVVVTNCYTTQVPEVQSTSDGDRWAPCEDTTIIIDGDQLYFNGDSIGTLAATDVVLVEHGKAKIVPR